MLFFFLGLIFGSNIWRDAGVKLSAMIHLNNGESQYSFEQKLRERERIGKDKKRERLEKKIKREFREKN